MNTASALTVLYDVLKDDNLSDLEKRKLIESFDSVLSLDLLKKEDIEDDFVKYIEEKIIQRKEAKENKNYALADSIREELLKKGIELKDTREGVIWNRF